MIGMKECFCYTFCQLSFSARLRILHLPLHDSICLCLLAGPLLFVIVQAAAICKQC